MGRGGGERPLWCQGAVYGTYLHGLFDAPGISDAVVRALCRRKGIPFPAAFNAAAHRERQYDLLAEAVRKELDMNWLYRMIGLPDK